MKTKTILAILTLAFTGTVYADANHAHSDHSKMEMQSNNTQKMDHSKMDHSKMDHSKMDHSKMTPKMMDDMHKSMEQEMIKIINTVDINQRKKLFIAHKNKMKSMQSMMKGKGNCSHGKH